MGKRDKRRRKRGPGPENIAARKAGLVITVTRRDAIVRQLDTAIWLWFFEHDALSIHILVSAACRCLEDLGKKAGLQPRARQILGHHLTLGYDWLRHASSDPKDTLDFPPRTNELLLWEVIISFENIFGGLTPYMRAFHAYFVLHLGPEYPELRASAQAFLPPNVDPSTAASLDRVAFLRDLVPLFAPTTSVQ